METNDDKEGPPFPPPPLITALVFSGGGPAGLLNYGAAKYLALANFWTLKNINRMDGCSIGAYLTVVLSLDYPFSWVDDYLIKRPWEKVLAKCLKVTSLWEMKGVLDVEFIKEMITPLLTAKGLGNDITLAGLYAFNQIELHFYTTDVNAEQLVKVDLSHTTHPDLTIVQALHMSMAFPLAFTPVPYKESLYIDGGLLNNFPLNDCLSTVPTENVLAFKNVWSKTALGNINVSKESSLAEFLMTVVKKMAFQLDTTDKQKVVPYTVECHLDSLDGFEDWVNTMSSPLSREVLVKKGEEDAQLFLTEISHSQPNLPKK